MRSLPIASSCYGRAVLRNSVVGPTKIDAAARPSLPALAKSLSNPDLKGSTIMIMGYGDGAGSRVHNQELSERRADAVKRYLVEKHGLTAGDLVAVGYGKLKDADHPLDLAYRRVRILNVNTRPDPK